GDHRGHERYYDRLREMVRDLRLDEVVFSGHVDDDELMAFYSVADLFLCLSEHEGFCVPLLEAMTFGIPVVAYDAGAVAETLPGAGVLVKDKRPDALAGLLQRVVGDAALRGAVRAGQQRRLAQARGADCRAT